MLRPALKTTVLCCLLAMVALSLLPLRATAKGEPTRILIIFDCSGSMRAKFGKEERMDVAKRILIHLVDSMKKVPNVDLALRCYGHQYPVPAHNCTDSKLEIPFAKGNADKIIQFVKQVQPNGWTPIAYSLQEAANDFPDTRIKNVILLITDGIEECEGDPCAAAKMLAEKKVAFKPYIIGIGLNLEKMKTFDCVGKYYMPKDERDLSRLTAGVISQALENTTLQVMLNDHLKKPNETHAEMTFSDAATGKVVYHYMHTMQAPGRPDTFALDPNIIYNLKVHTLPPLERKNISLQTAHHNIVSLNAAQGELQLRSTGVEYRGLLCLVRQKGKSATLNVQEMGASRRYLEGEYEVEILCLPRLKKSVTLVGGETVTVETPAPGKAEITYNRDIIGSIYVLRAKKQEWLQEIKGGVATGKDLFLFQPGTYKVVYRQARNSRTEFTKEAEFQITSGGFVKIMLD